MLIAIAENGVFEVEANLAVFDVVSDVTLQNAQAGKRAKSWEAIVF